MAIAGGKALKGNMRMAVIMEALITDERNMDVNAAAENVVGADTGMRALKRNADVGNATGAERNRVSMADAVRGVAMAPAAMAHTGIRRIYLACSERADIFFITGQESRTDRAGFYTSFPNGVK